MRFKHALHCINYLYIKNPKQTQAISNNQKTQTQNNDKTHTHRAKSCHNFLLPALDAATLALGWYSVYYLSFSPRKQPAEKYSLQSGSDYCG